MRFLAARGVRPLLSLQPLGSGQQLRGELPRLIRGQFGLPASLLRTDPDVDAAGGVLEIDGLLTFEKKHSLGHGVKYRARIVLRSMCDLEMRLQARVENEVCATLQIAFQDSDNR